MLVKYFDLKSKKIKMLETGMLIINIK